MPVYEKHDWKIMDERYTYIVNFKFYTSKRPYRIVIVKKLHHANIFALSIL